MDGKRIQKVEQRKKLIPKMILTYCRGNHKKQRKEEGVKRNELCSRCKELETYASFRLEQFPFKKNKGFLFSL